MIRTWTPESENEKPPKNEKAQLVRAWFERLPRMRAQIQQQEERIVDLQCIATATTSSVSAAPGRSGTSDKVGNGGAAIVEAEEKLAALKCEYVLRGSPVSRPPLRWALHRHTRHPEPSQ